MENKYSKPNTTRKKVKFLGTKEFIDASTGEKETMQVTNIEERDANFHKIWLGHMLESLDMIGNQKIRVAMFIMENINKENERSEEQTSELKSSLDLVCVILLEKKILII